MPSADLVQQRLANQHLSGSGLRQPQDVVRGMGAMQAQDYGQALWAIGCRLRAGTVADVAQAIEDGVILRTWPMRGTIHFVPAQDAAWLQRLSAERMLASDARRLAQLELDHSVVLRAQGLLLRVLTGVGDSRGHA